jgi:hypothetical protein
MRAPELLEENTRGERLHWLLVQRYRNFEYAFLYDPALDELDELSSL